MKNVQIPLMIFILSCSFFHFHSPFSKQCHQLTTHSISNTHTHTVMFIVQSHINIANMSNYRLTQRYWGAASNSDTRVETSDVEFNNDKLTILYRMLQF